MSIAFASIDHFKLPISIKPPVTIPQAVSEKDEEMSQS